MSKIRTPWRAVAASFVLLGGMFGVWASRIPAFKSALDIDTKTLGVLLFLIAFGGLCAFALAGRAADQMGAYKVTKIFAVAVTVSLLSLPFAPNIYVLGALLFIFGALMGGMDVAMNTWASEVEKAMQRPVMASFHAMFSLGAGLGALSGYFAVKAGLAPGAHFALAGLLIFALCMPFLMIPWQSQINQNPQKHFVIALPKGALFFVALIAFCSSIGEGAMLDWSAIYLQSVAQVSEAKAALGLTVFSVAMVVMRFAGDRVISKLGPVNSARMAGWLAGAGALIAVVFTSFASVLLGFAMMGLGYALIVPLAFSRASNDPEIPAGAAIASVATLGYSGMLLGPPVIGMIAHLSSLRVAFLMLSIMAFLILPMAKVLRPASD